MDRTFDRLYEQYHQSIYQFIFYMVRDQNAAEELVQDVYIKVLGSYENFDGKSNEKTWLFSIAKHLAIDYIRKENRQKRKWLGTIVSNDKIDVHDPAPLPEEIALAKDEVRAVYEALGTCSIAHRQVLILRFIQSLSVKETAESLGWSESKVKTTQHRAIKQMRKILNTEEREEGSFETQSSRRRHRT
ncbi:sigma-70 family RNA polymerase sigma factor [Salicibibacter halophilus]|uniref:RNA polymerase sigma factor n=1 Tax=Salicibibacter halophilus TaxID=2502791 RepID=A0A514LMV9_9BACI|nr:RNA polymerase sigma factor SigX [Salicibibacter halophilus]QDI93168.1 sigma-70 family RNA polymerase sigma factor [Salicibibacter halophilus]